MSTFAKTTFDSAVYAACRPTYPKYLFELIFNYHRDGPTSLPSPLRERGKLTDVNLPRPVWDVAVDLGCGTGQATTELLPFKRIIGVEPSSGMIGQAKKYVQERFGEPSSPKNGVNSSRFEFVQSPAEELGFLENDSVDLVIAAQAAHWFDWDKLWPELGRVLRPNGTVAFWVYSEFRLPRYPTLTPLITDYLQGTSLDESLGPYWQRPGRTILERHLVDVPEPANIKGAEGLFVGDGTDRVYFAGSYHPSLPTSQTLPVILNTQTTWNGLMGYLRTFSSLHTYLEKHPGDAEREDGNIAERIWKSLKQSAEQAEGNGVVLKGEDDLLVEWPVALVLTKKK